MEMMTLYRLNDSICVRDDVTMITIDNLSGDNRVMASVLCEIAKMDMNIDILDYHNSYKGSKLTILVENSGILRITGAVGMFKDKMNGLICDVYCLNTAVTVATQKTPLDDAAAIMRAFSHGGIELYHLFSGSAGITLVINEAYTDRACSVLEKIFKKM